MCVKVKSCTSKYLLQNARYSSCANVLKCNILAEDRNTSPRVFLYKGPVKVVECARSHVVFSFCNETIHFWSAQWLDIFDVSPSILMSLWGSWGDLFQVGQQTHCEKSVTTSDAGAEATEDSWHRVCMCERALV